VPTSVEKESSQPERFPSAVCRRKVLEERFKMTEVIGPRRRFALAFLDLIARLFGDETAASRKALLDGLAW
jgi:hypothetical protein